MSQIEEEGKEKLERAKWSLLTLDHHHGYDGQGVGQSRHLD